MEHGALLGEFVVLLAVAVAVTFLSHRLRIPPVVGFLITGVLIGPSALGLIRDPEQVEIMAEIGVVALLFTTGLEFSSARLRLLRRPFLVGGSLQVLGTIAIVFGISRLTDVSPARSLFFGFVIALSSTAIVLKLLTDARQIDSPHGRISVGILIFQDFFVVPMIVLTPLLAGHVEASLTTMAIRFGVGLGILALAVLAARFLMPRILAILARTRVREIFILGSLFLVLGMSLLTNSLDFSTALGAFLAGILLAESEYSHQIFADVVPFRDVFSSLFFISIGMLLDVGALVEEPVQVLLLAGGIIVLKAAIVTAIVLAMRFPLRTALVAAFTLAQIGEFSFVLLTVEGAVDLIGPAAFQSFIGASVLTMIATPLLLALAPRLSARLEGLASARVEGEEPRAEHHVVVVGYGVNGRNLVRVLREVGIRHVVIELDGQRAELARKEGATALYGDASRPEILELAGVPRSSVAVFGFADFAAVERGIRFARSMNRTLHIIVRTRLVSEIEALYAAGADEVVAEEFETSIEIFTRVLHRLHVPRNVIEAETRVLRGDSYEILRAPRGAKGISESVLDLLTAGATEIFLVRESGALPGLSLIDLKLRERTGASIIAIVRDQQAFPSPDPTFELQAGDHLILMGGHAQIEEAFRYLEDAEREGVSA